MKDWTDKLLKLNPCQEAVDWASQYESMKEVWEHCRRGDWMLWLAGRLCDGEDGRKQLVLCACECARTSLKHVAKGENRPRVAIETAEAWARGEEGVSLGDVRNAAAAADAAAYAAAYAATTATAAAAAYAAAYAAAAADAAAAAYAAYAAASSVSLAKSADIVRKHYPDPPNWKETPNG